MPKVSGQADVQRLFASIPANATAILRGAARAAANVVADEAKLRSISAEVTGAIKVRASTKGGTIIGKVQVRGPGAYIAPWLEYGTAPHYISVNDTDRAGRSIGRINRLGKEGSLTIGGAFVGPSVFHPGARAHPFLRPALDTKEAEAIAAAQTYINSRVTPAGFANGDAGGDDE